MLPFIFFNHFSIFFNVYRENEIKPSENVQNYVDWQMKSQLLIL